MSMTSGLKIQTKVPTFVSTVFWNYLFTLNLKGCVCVPIITRSTQQEHSPFQEDHQIHLPLFRSFSPCGIPWGELFPSWNTSFPFYHLPRGQSWNSLGEHSNVYCLKNNTAKIFLSCTIPWDIVTACWRVQAVLG